MNKTVFWFLIFAVGCSCVGALAYIYYLNCSENEKYTKKAHVWFKKWYENHLIVVTVVGALLAIVAMAVLSIALSFKSEFGLIFGWFCIPFAIVNLSAALKAWEANRQKNNTQGE